jgi:hypothetical protein
MSEKVLLVNITIQPVTKTALIAVAVCQVVDGLSKQKHVLKLRLLLKHLRLLLKHLRLLLKPQNAAKAKTTTKAGKSYY